MENNKGFINWNISAGKWLYNFLILQVLFIVFTLKGGILFGIFPSIASLFNILYKWIAFDRYDLSILKEFKAFYKGNFWETNKLGFLMLGIGMFLTFDLYVSSVFIKSILLHIVLVLFFLVLDRKSVV